MDKPKTTPRDFFLYLATFAALYVSTISLISLLFEVVNRLFPDQITNGYYYDYSYSSGLRLAIASLLIVFPAYLALASYLHRSLVRSPERRDIAVRKWLTYLTLFVTGIVVVVDLVMLVNTFLGGEITARFISKVFVVFIVSGAVFAYYLYDLRKTFVADMQSHTKSLVVGASSAVLLSLLGGFVVLGSPMEMRDLRFDDRRLSDLQSIQWQIVNYWQQKESLPKDLSSVADPISGAYIPTDPETGTPYEYEKTGALSFRLCATFALPSRTDVYGRGLSDTRPSFPGMDGENWAHDLGRSCFDRTIDPDRYPPYIERLNR